MIKEVHHNRYFMGSLPNGTDLIEGFTDICEKEKIILGRVDAIGAVQKARFGYFNQQSREYQFFEKNSTLEILKCSGNISLNNDKPMVHAHVILADENGDAFGGHLAKGTIVFACEFIIQAFDNTVLFKRDFDSTTGLRLWKEE